MMLYRSGLAILCIFAAVSFGHAAEPSKAESDPLLRLNGSFRKAHAAARKVMLSKCSPIVIVDGDNLILIRNGQRTEARGIPEIYHTLKAAAHAPVAVQLLLAPFGDGVINEERMGGLKEYRDQLEKAEKSLVGRGLSEEQLKRSTKLLAGCRTFLADVIKNERIAHDKVRAFAREMSSLVIEQATDAAWAQLDTTHQQMTKWRGQLSADEWKALHVVIIGSAMPRKGNLAVQYFSRLLGEKGEGLRIHYAESLWDEAKALNLLAVSLVDSNMAVDFFNDEIRMHIDLLAPLAEKLLKKMDFER